jgi:methylmalonyl-CoA/ethylmalonyl-CoA epimerase|tara:strand:+ start:702 stop:1106 length:405 start_codon:yes stop_codon:yes gene_type:complete
MNKIDHIGVVVKDINKANQLFETILKTSSYKKEYVKSEDVSTSFFKLGDSKIELISSNDPEHTINKYINNQSSSLHHFAIRVDDIIIEMKRISSLGIRLLNDTPKLGADNMLICFLHPKDTYGVLIELCQEINQ